MPPTTGIARGELGAPCCIPGSGKDRTRNETTLLTGSGRWSERRRNILRNQIDRVRAQRHAHIMSSFLGALRCSSTCVPIIALLAFGTSAVAQNASLPELQRIDHGRLCVTNGVVSALAGDRLTIDTASSRAIAQVGGESASDQIAEIHFKYLGPSQDSRPLASGVLRRQIGLKLRAQDSCNLIYAMWRIEPDTGVTVSLKRNAGLHTHRECGAHGYVNFKSQDRGDLPPIRPGEVHQLRAELQGSYLAVTADGKVAWQGALGDEMALPVGPPGFRTDNARFTLEYFTTAGAPSRQIVQQPPPGRGACVTSEGD
jgi:hypothetical protein